MFESPYHDYWEPPVTAASDEVIARLGEASRAENVAAASRLRAVCELFEMRRNQRGERADWAVDTWAAVGAEIAAALRISLAKAGSYMNYGLAMLQLPAVAAVFEAGDIDMGVFSAIVFRTALITDEAAMAAVDAELAQRVTRWPSMTRGRLATEIDRVVARHDRDAVRRSRERVADRHLSVWDRATAPQNSKGCWCRRMPPRWMRGSMRWLPPSARRIRGPWSSAARMRWGHWRSEWIAWPAAAGRPTALRGRHRRRGKSSSTSLPRRRRWRVAPTSRPA